MTTANFLIAGVGGQGTLLVSDIVADVGMRVGADVKKSEVHGMSQRGGAVTSHVRWGERMASPLCGETDAVELRLAPPHQARQLVSARARKRTISFVGCGSGFWIREMLLEQTRPA